MKNYKETFGGELDEFIERGDKLKVSLLAEVGLLSAESKDAFEEVKDKYPDFCKEYDSWYTPVLRLIRVIMPERLNDFIGCYKREKRKEITYESYSIYDMLTGLVVRRGQIVIADGKSAVAKFSIQLSILSAVKSIFNSKLCDIEESILASIYDKELNAAGELLKNNFLRSAGMIAGVVLEKHLFKIIQDHSLKVKHNPSINDLNECLKSNELIDVPIWRFVQRLGDIRNLCCHNKDREPTNEEVLDLINGVDKIIKTVF